MKLYKYLSADRVDVLVHALIRYTPPGAFNDPFEVRPHVARLGSPEYIDQLFNEVLPAEALKFHDALPPVHRDLLSAETIERLVVEHLRQSGTSAYELFEGFAPALRSALWQGFNGSLGILSLTEHPDNLLMWSHYADSHAGFVVGFDSAHPHFDERTTPADEFRHVRKVAYRDERPSGSLVDFNHVDVFFVKSRHWEHEAEWRIIRALAHADQSLSGEPFPVHLFGFPRESVVDVIVGSRTSDQVRSEIQKVLCTESGYRNTRLFEATPHEKRFEIEIREIRRECD